MSKITVAETATSVVASSTVDTLVAVGSKPVNIYTGDNTGIDLDDYAPIGAGERVIFPAGLDVTAWSRTGDAQVWVIDFGTA